jgi:hypothetical protein
MEAPGKNTPKGKAANRKGYACRVCGIQYEEMPSTGKECVAHKKDAAALLDQLKKRANLKDAAQQDNDNFAKFEKMKKEAGTTAY